MRSLTEHLWCEVPNRRGFINITPTVAELVRKSGVSEGLCNGNAMHITASVFIIDNESGLKRQIMRHRTVTCNLSRDSRSAPCIGALAPTVADRRTAMSVQERAERLFALRWGGGRRCASVLDPESLVLSFFVRRLETGDPRLPGFGSMNVCSPCVGAGEG